MPRHVALALIRNDRIIPLFDGLDEVPDGLRRECKDQIDAFAGTTSPYRNFVVTCREADYGNLRPRWVVSDQIVKLIGLEPAQAAAVLRERTGEAPGWGEVCDELSNDSPILTPVFTSPLRLAIALQAFRAEGSAAELLNSSSTRGAITALWNLFLRADRTTFASAPHERMRTWLTTLADAMLPDRQYEPGLEEVEPFYRLRLEEFESLFHRDLRFKLFRWAVRLVISALAAVAYLFAAPYGSANQSLEGFFVAAYIAFAATFVVLYREQFTGTARRVALLLGATGQVGWYIAGVVGAGGLIVALDWTGVLRNRLAAAVVYGAMVGALHLVISMRWFSGQPHVDRHPGPLGGVTPVRNNGLVGAAVVGASVGAVAGLALVLINEDPTSAATGGALIGASVGLIAGLELGLDFWLFYHWFRYRYWLDGLLPRKLPQFLDWCTQPERQWLREFAGAYEFRHLEFLRHLGRTSTPHPRTGPRSIP
jgi:hypothetical protein